MQIEQSNDRAKAVGRCRAAAAATAVAVGRQGLVAVLAITVGHFFSDPDYAEMMCLGERALAECRTNTASVMGRAAEEDLIEETTLVTKVAADASNNPEKAGSEIRGHQGRNPVDTHRKLYGEDSQRRIPTEKMTKPSAVWKTRDASR